MSEAKEPPAGKRRYILGAAVIVLTVAAVFFFRSTDRQSSPVGDIDGNRFLLDTVVSLKLYESEDEDLLEEAFDYIATLESELSRHDSGSEVSRLNSNAGLPTTISANTIEVLDSAIGYAELTGGAFDPTIGPLVDLWGIGGDNPRIPGETEIATALSFVDYRQVTFDREKGSATLNNRDMELDLGGVAKGWIADEVERMLRQNGASHILINLGGNVRVSGGKPDGSAYRIGMQDPADDRGSYLGIFHLNDGSVVSSGVYERFFEQDGVRYHHILDTTTGRPVENGLSAVTVVSELSVDGDALSTALFALGLERGLALADSLSGVEAAYVTDNGTVVMTSGAAEMFEATRNDLVVEVR